ncbi:hypothetical protein AWB71_04317 [Caballeronia peredens]|nr:hypothetical protein AWB71_04317 [Caballeronia peredens]
MTVDFSLLPSETPEPDKPPSRLVWAVVFLVLVLIGIFIVLFAWPKGRSTQTSDFWGAVILFPVGIPALIVLLRFQHYFAQKLDVQLNNKAVRQYNDRVFSAASMPLAVLGASYRFSAIRAENDIASVQTGGLRLTVRELFARDSEPEKVRWLDVPNVKLRSGTEEDDRKRQIEVTRWLFAEMIAELAGAIRTLPAQVVLKVNLLISGLLTSKQNEALWRECWGGFGLRPALVGEPAAQSGNLQMIDAWLDRIVRGDELEVKLIVSVQLHPLMNGSPPKGTAEAGVALLLMPDALAIQHGSARIANLHRPVRGTFEQSNEALAHALKWGSSTSASISGGWQTGLALAQSGVLRASTLKAGLEVQAIDLDPRIGYAGVAAPWLATACAVRSLTADLPRQIVFAGQVEGVDCAVLRATASETSSVISMEGGAVAELTTEHWRLRHDAPL